MVARVFPQQTRFLKVGALPISGSITCQSFNHLPIFMIRSHHPARMTRGSQNKSTLLTRHAQHVVLNFFPGVCLSGSRALCASCSQSLACSSRWPTFLVVIQLCSPTSLTIPDRQPRPDLYTHLENPCCLHHHLHLQDPPYGHLIRYLVHPTQVRCSELTWYHHDGHRNHNCNDHATTITSTHRCPLSLSWV